MQSYYFNVPHWRKPLKKRGWKSNVRLESCNKFPIKKKKRLELKDLEVTSGIRKNKTTKERMIF